MSSVELKPAMANAAIFKNPLDTDPAETFEFEAGCTLNEWLDDSGFREFLSITPTLVLLNNEAMLEAEWDTVTQEYDVITLVPQPFITGIEIAALVGFVISILSAGYALYLALTVDTPDPGDEKNSSTYSISYRGNHKRPGQPIPVAYGVCRVYPDLSSEIWSEYDENGDQIKIMLFEFTQGEAAIEDMRFEETPLSNYQDIVIEILQPGVSSFVYPNTVNNVAGVTNIELDTLVSSTYVVCPDGQLASYMFLDFVAPQGLWTRSETTGTTFSHEVLIYVEYRIHGSGGAWIPQTKLAPYSMDPWRATGKILFPTPGQYEVRVSRVHPRISEARTADAVFWTGLRAFIHDTTGAPDTTRVAIRMRASDQVGNLALSEFSGVVHRKLPIYNGSSWSAPQYTGSPVWAFCDACRAAYGGKRPDSYLDMAALVALDSRFGSTRVFSGIFETSIPLWQALQEIARVMLARPIEKPGGQLTMIVDELASGPSAMFTMASIEKGSFKLDQVGYTAQTNDSVTITFKDEVQEYRDTSVTFKPFGSAGANPAERTLRGVTTLAGAGLVGWRMANENRFRRISATWRTGIEGYLPTYGDTVRVQHWMLGVDLGVTTLSGSIVSKSGSTMYVNEDLSGIGGSGQCYITGSAGGVNGPYSCSVSSNSFTVSGDTSAVTFADNLQRPQFIVGRSGDFVSNIKLTSITNVGEHVYELSGFVDNINAYIEDEAPLNTQLGASDKLTPTIEDLRYTLDGQEHLYDLRLSWREINVDRSQVEQSTDNGSTYQIINEQAHQSHTILGLEAGLVTGGALWYRVTGFNLGAGPSVTINIGAPAYVVPPPTNFVLVREFIGSATTRWDAPPINHRVKIDAWWGGELQRTSISDRAVTMADYTWYDSVEDNPGSYLGAVNTTDGARDIIFYASTLDDADVESTTVQVAAYNSQIGALTNVQFWELSQGGLRVSYQQPDGPDFYGVEIHLSKTNGFTPDMTYPGSSTRAYAGRQNDITIAGVLTYPDDWYMLVAGVDKWGRDGLVWSQQEHISTIDGITHGVIEWDDITGPNKPEDGAQVNNPGAFGIKMNVTSFYGVYAPGYFYIHAYSGGAGVDEDINLLCNEIVEVIPKKVGVAKHNGLGFLAYDVQERNHFLVEQQGYNLAYVFYEDDQWYFDPGEPGDPYGYGEYKALWNPAETGFYIIAEIEVSNNIVVAATTWAAGRTPAQIVASFASRWLDIHGRPTDEALLNEKQEWDDLKNIDANVWNSNQAWTDIGNVPDTEIYNEHTTWVNLGDPAGAPPILLNENVLYAGLSDAPADSAIYNDQQYYSDVIGDKPDIAATQNGERGIFYDPGCNLSAAPGASITTYFPLNAGCTAYSSGGKNDTPCILIAAASSLQYLGSHLVGARKGDRFYMVAILIFEYSSMANEVAVYFQEHDKDGSANGYEGAALFEARTDWQSTTYVYEVAKESTEYLRIFVRVSDNQTSGAIIVDSIDAWPITESYNEDNIGYYIDNLAIKTALIKDAAISNLKVAGDALFLPASLTYSGSVDNYYSIPGNSTQIDNWRGFASFDYDMTGSAPGQKLIVHSIFSEYMTFEFDRPVTKAWLDMRVMVNGSTLLDYIYQADLTWENIYAGGDGSYGGLVYATPHVYYCGSFYSTMALNPSGLKQIQLTDTMVDSPAASINHIEIQFRIACQNSESNWTSAIVTYGYGQSRAILAGGRSS